MNNDGAINNDKQVNKMNGKQVARFSGAGIFCLIYVTFIKIRSTAHYFVLIPMIFSVVNYKGLAYFAALLLTISYSEAIQPTSLTADHALLLRLRCSSWCRIDITLLLSRHLIASITLGG